MSRDRMELIRTLIGRWNAGDHDPEGLPEYVDPAFELESPFSSVVGEPYRGYTGIKEWARDLDEQFAEWSIGLEEVRQVGDRVITIATIDARGRASDVTLRFRSASVFDFGGDDRVTRVHIYLDVDDALTAVGLERWPMSPGNVETAKRGMDAFDRRDIDALLELSTPQPTLSSALPDAGADFRGREGLERYFAMLAESWDAFHTVIDEYRDLGDRVVMLGRFTGRRKGSPAMVDAPSGAVFDFRDDKVSRMRLYLDHGEALRAVGLTD